MLSVARPARQPCTGGSTSKPGRSGQTHACSSTCQLSAKHVAGPRSCTHRGCIRQCSLRPMHGAHSGSGGDWGEGESPRVSRGRRLVCKCSARALTIASLRIAAGRLQAANNPPPRADISPRFSRPWLGGFHGPLRLGAWGSHALNQSAKPPGRGKCFDDFEVCLCSTLDLEGENTLPKLQKKSRGGLCMPPLTAPPGAPQLPPRRPTAP